MAYPVGAAPWFVDNQLTKNILLLSFDGLDAPVALIDCAHLVEPFSRLCNGWAFSEISASDIPPFMTVSKIDTGYRIDCTPLSKPRDTYEPEEYKDECAIICAMIADLSTAFGRFNETVFSLHCAGLMIGQRLVVFAAMGRSGKSTMSVHLTAAGARYFSDDVLPFFGDDGHIISLGFAPRLRLPLSDRVDQLFKDFVSRRGDLANKRYQYILPEDDKWAPHGERASISAVVLLDRDPECTQAVLAEAKKSEALKRLVGQNFDSNLDISKRFQRLHDLAGDVTCHHLRYAETGEAVPLLFEAFGA